MSKRLAVILVFALVAGTGGLAAVVASGGGDDGPATPATSASSATDAAGLELAVRVYSGAFLAGDARSVHALMSGRCQALFPQEQLAPLVAAASADFGDARLTSLSVDVQGTEATATYAFTRAELDQTGERWVVEDGGWRNDTC